VNLEQLPLKSKKDKERYVAGTELPYKGRCKHYRKSTRWFRFSCCSKVHPCDRCHDEAENHPSEHANRMICGLCSREQNYRPEDCRFCGNSFIAKKLSHYWEGGKGTRDKRYSLPLLCSIYISYPTIFVSRLLMVYIQTHGEK
jgi:uncharacterized CHY-type Zn-finger protein